MRRVWKICYTTSFLILIHIYIYKASTIKSIINTFAYRNPMRYRRRRGVRVGRVAEPDGGLCGPVQGRVLTGYQ